MPTSELLNEKDIWGLLNTVMDPEIPVISLVELGVIREVSISGSRIDVVITPTFSGCPAFERMKTDIREVLQAAGDYHVHIDITLSPPWSTDWIDDQARGKLKAFGLSTGSRHGGNVSLVLFDPVACPFCESENTTLKNNWGTTPCRAMFYCNHCQQPFEQFKPL